MSKERSNSRGPLRNKITEIVAYTRKTTLTRYSIFTFIRVLLQELQFSKGTLDPKTDLTLYFCVNSYTMSQKSSKGRNILNTNGLVCILAIIQSFKILSSFCSSARRKFPKTRFRVMWMKGRCLETDISKNIRAATWQNQQNGCAPSEDSDQPGESSAWPSG